MGKVSYQIPISKENYQLYKHKRVMWKCKWLKISSYLLPF